MKKMIPLNKQRKKALRNYHAKQRASWNGVSPITRMMPSGKVYDRKKLKLTKIEEERD